MQPANESRSQQKLVFDGILSDLTTPTFNQSQLYHLAQSRFSQCMRASTLAPDATFISESSFSCDELQGVKRIGDMLSTGLINEKDHQKYNRIWSHSVDRILKILNVQCEYVINRDQGYVVFAGNKDNAETAALPNFNGEYSISGGGARYALNKSLGRNYRSEKIRDIDLVKIGKSHSAWDRVISQVFMADDFFRNENDGVRLYNSLDEYFSTRDITLNEVLYCNGNTFATFQAILDTLSNVYRPTNYTRWNSNQDNRNAILCKVLRLFSQDIVNGIDSDLRGLATPHNDKNKMNIRPFWISVHLNRCFECEEGVAQKYIDLCIKFRFKCIFSQCKTVEDAILRLSKFLKRGIHFFDKYHDRDFIRSHASKNIEWSRANKTTKNQVATKQNEIISQPKKKDKPAFKPVDPIHTDEQIVSAENYLSVLSSTCEHYGINRPTFRTREYFPENLPSYFKSNGLLEHSGFRIHGIGKGSTECEAVDIAAKNIYTRLIGNSNPSIEN